MGPYTKRNNEVYEANKIWYDIIDTTMPSCNNDISLRIIFFSIKNCIYLINFFLTFDNNSSLTLFVDYKGGEWSIIIKC